MSNREDLLYLLHEFGVQIDYEDEDYMYFYTTDRADIKDLNKRGHNCSALTDITCPPIYCRASKTTTKSGTVLSSHT